MNCYPSSRSSNSSDDKKDDKEDLNGLIAFSEGSLPSASKGTTSTFISRIKKEKQELDKCQLGGKATGFNPKRKETSPYEGTSSAAKKKGGNKKPHTSPDDKQPTISQCVARMKSPPANQIVSSSKSSDITKTYTPSDRTPVNLKKIASSEDSSHDSDKSDSGNKSNTDSIARHPEDIRNFQHGPIKGRCDLCDSGAIACHLFLYRDYCYTYAYQDFYDSPAEWSRKKTAASYTKGYNIVLDYIYFFNNDRLIKDAKYWIPACLMKNMNELSDEIEEDLKDYRVIGRMQNLYEKKDNDKELWTTPEFLGHLDTDKMSGEEIYDLEEQKDRCSRCLLKKEDCHKVLFSKYCKLKVMRMLHLYRDAMSRERAEDLYIKYFRRALQVHMFYKFDMFARRDKMFYPTKCLMYEMEDLLNDVHNLHVAQMIRKSSNGNHEMTEWKHNDMNFHGNNDD